MRKGREGEKKTGKKNGGEKKGKQAEAEVVPSSS